MSETEVPGAGERFAAFVELIARLRAPGGCPWDREQTHESLKPMTIEEAYEVLEAIDDGDAAELAGELGDLLLQVVFHAQIAAEAGRFDVAAVIERVADKMIRRHPHVFGDAQARDADDVLRSWEALKARELREKGRSPEAASMLDSVSRRLPAVLEAFQITTKASRVGFDWPDAEAVLDKLHEEIAEYRAAATRTEPVHAEMSEEIGDLLFAAVNLARVVGVDPESALKSANRKFRRRFRHVEARLREAGREPAEASLADMEALWEESKARERGGPA
jgi:tetrapyrrole methylase family protein/MazG family protein